MRPQPEWIRRYFQKGIGSLKQIEIVELLNSADILAFTSDYEILLKQMPAKWQEYRKRLKREFDSLVPKGKPGRPVEQHKPESITSNTLAIHPMPILRSKNCNQSRKAK